MKTIKYIFYFLFFCVLDVYSQSDENPFKFWQLINASGRISGVGNYREFTNEYSGFKNTTSEKFLTGILQMKTKSYFVHPNFMLVNLNGIYNGSTSRTQYIGPLNTSEKTNMEGFDGSVLFFQRKNFNLSTSGSTYQSISNVDNLTRVREKDSYLMNTFSYMNTILPFQVSYTTQKTEQKSIDQDRSYTFRQRQYQGLAYKSFSSIDNSNFSFLHSENHGSQHEPGRADIFQTSNILDQYQFSNSLTFGPNHFCSLSSTASNSLQRGIVKYNVFAVMENLSLRLPYHFSLANEYHYGRTSQASNIIHYELLRSTLTHHLYESLSTRLLFERTVTSQSGYLEQRNKSGADISYIKKVRNGRLSVYYGYYREYQSVKNPPTSVNIIRDEYILSDNQITLLKNQYVAMQTIVVRDVSGTILYRPGIDYVLVDKYPYTEIIRLPGGMITNNGSVYLDYTAIKPGLFEMNINTHNLNTDLSMLQGKLSVYYRFYSQDFGHLSGTENQALNVFTRNTIGLRVNFPNVNGGAEYEDYHSNIVPYRGMKYFISIQKMYHKWNFGLNSSYSDYQMSNENTRRKDLNIASNLAYDITQRTKVNAEYLYRNMKGQSINLELHDIKLQVMTRLHLLFIAVGSDLYWSRSGASRIFYKDVFVQLTRNF